MRYTMEMETALHERGYTVDFFCNGYECDIFFEGRYVETLDGGHYVLYNWMCDREML